MLEVLQAQPPLPGLPDTVPADVTAVLAPDPAAFERLLGGRVPEWSAGVAVPSRRLLVLPGWRSSLIASSDAVGVLRHEWAHLGLHAWLDPYRIPRWFDEGYAEWAEGWDASEAWRLRVLLATGSTPPLDSLRLAWPRQSAEAGAAYLLSATVLEYLVDRSGERALRLLLERWRTGGSFEGALRGTYGVTVGQLEEDWRAWVERRYGWLYVLSNSAVLWGLMGVMLLVLFGIRRRRDRARLERMREEEPPDRPAYWLGEIGEELPGGEEAESGPEGR